MSKLNSLSNSETFETLFSEIADDLAEAINGGTAHNCHKNHNPAEKWDVDSPVPYQEKRLFLTF